MRTKNTQRGAGVASGAKRTARTTGAGKPRSPRVRLAPTQGAGNESTLRASSRSRVVPPPASSVIFPGSGLSLPRISKKIPGRIQLGRDDSPRLLAEALFRGGILRDSDWLHDFESTITHGLTRWINSEIHLNYLQEFDLLFGYAEQPAPIRENAPGGDDLGSFELICDDGPNMFYVGPAIEEMNAVAANAGYATFKILEAALSATLGCWGPSSVYDHLNESDWFDQCLRDEISVAEDEGRRPALFNIPSTYLFCKMCPFTATDSAKSTFDPKRALRKARKNAVPGSWQDRVLDQVEDLEYSMKDFRPNNGRYDLSELEYESNEIDTYYAGAAIIGWQPNDCIDQVVYEFRDNAWQVGAMSNTLMWSPWNLRQPETIPAALEIFRCSAPIIRACDNLLALLARPVRAGEEPFKTYPVPKVEKQRWQEMWPKPAKAPLTLMEIFGDEAADEPGEPVTRS